eukprot:TRINITY_DN1102_c0_g1_i1.p1 TRINITY_DN1102_c0_g1~~TRINITY_DN1102_c0_g1_i1.p1  ORF type:complete len:237 (-),score=72.10 TRINITY_DN1102_c0_g1_i1:92-802(-)
MFATDFNRNLNVNALKDLNPLDKATYDHLLLVYATLGAGLLVAAVGSIANLYIGLGGFMTFILGIPLLFWLTLTPHTSQNAPKRVGAFLGFTFLEGCTLSPLLYHVCQVDPRLVSAAFFGTVCVFICFSLSAIFSSRQRTHLLVGGMLASALTLTMFVGLLNIFLQSAGLNSFLLYTGLLTFCGFVLYDTQLIIEKKKKGSNDFVQHALELFLDFIQIFVRLLIILSKDKKKKDDK